MTPLLRATPALTLISVIAGCLAAAVFVAMGPHPPRVAGFGLTEVDASSATQDSSLHVLQRGASAPAEPRPDSGTICEVNFSASPVSGFRLSPRLTFRRGPSGEPSTSCDAPRLRRFAERRTRELYARSRESQAVFRCVHCGHADNADVNAAKEILRRGAPGLDVEARVTGPTKRQSKEIQHV